MRPDKHYGTVGQSFLLPPAAPWHHPFVDKHLLAIQRRTPAANSRPTQAAPRTTMAAPSSSHPGQPRFGAQLLTPLCSMCPTGGGQGAEAALHGGCAVDQGRVLVGGVQGVTLLLCSADATLLMLVRGLSTDCHKLLRGRAALTWCGPFRHAVCRGRGRAKVRVRGRGPGTSTQCRCSFGNCPTRRPVFMPAQMLTGAAPSCLGSRHAGSLSATTMCRPHGR